MAAKKKDWTELLGGPSKNPEDVAAADGPAEPPATVFMHTIVGNPDNPRPEEDYSDDDPEFRELKASMREIGQLQPLAVVSRPVFQQAKPAAIDRASDETRALLLDADWVVVTGNRRLAAARQLGWTRIDIRVQDQLGDEDGRIDEAVIIENIQRKNLAPIREAEYLRAMVERHGSQEKVAERIGKTQVYVSQRLALLKLAPDLRDQVDAGALKLKDARQLASRTQDHAKQRQMAAQVRQQRAEPKPPRVTPEPGPVQNPVLKLSTVSGQPEQNGLVQNPVLETPPQHVPDPRADPAPALPAQTIPEGGKLPYDDGPFVAQHLIVEMPTDALEAAIRVLYRHAQEQGLNITPEHAS